MNQGARVSEGHKARRQRILDSTLALLSERGIENVSTRMIAKASGVAEKTIFNIFGSKDRLVAAATFDRSEDTFIHARERGEGDGWPFLIALVDEIVAVTLKRPEVSRALVPLLLNAASGARVDSLYIDHVTPSLAAMVKAGDLRADAPVDELVRRIRIGFICTLVAWTGGEIGDAEIRGFMLEAIAGCLLAHTTEPFLPILRDIVREVTPYS